MGKKLDLELARKRRYYRSKSLKPYKNPYDCPKCFQSKQLKIKKIKQKNSQVSWLCVCSSCGLRQKIILPAIYERIDVYTKLCEIVKGEKSGKMSNLREGI